jgi:hypothetical protein
MSLIRIITAATIIAAATAGANAGDAYYLNGAPAARSAADAIRGYPEWREEVDAYENPAIAMTAEEVVITLHPEYADVVATFDFTNTLSDVRDVEMCFPISYLMLGLDPYETEEPSFDYAGLSADFAVAVDGEDTNYLFAKGVGGYAALATWDVRFEGGASRRVVCSYADPYASTGVTYDYRAYYALFTGATWKGPIGRGVITVRPGDDFDWSLPLYYLSAGTPPARDEGEKVVWEFEELEPPFAAAADVGPDPNHYKYVLWAAGICVGFPDTETYPGPAAGRVTADGLNFRTKADPAAANVAARPTLEKWEEVKLIERRGEWYRLETKDGAEGWARWRYVDPDTGRVNIYVELVITDA